MELLMAKTVEIPAESTDRNILVNERYERPPFHAIGSLFLTGSGTASTDLTAELNINGVSMSEAVNVSTENRIPLVPDDVAIAEFECPAGGKIQLIGTNTTAAALNLHYKIILSPDPRYIQQ